MAAPGLVVPVHGDRIRPIAVSFNSTLIVSSQSNRVGIRMAVTVGVGM